MRSCRPWPTAGNSTSRRCSQAQVKRLLADPRSRALFDGFGAQWLGLGELESKTFDTAKFPQMTGEMRSAMYDEARLFFESIVRENRSVVSFVDSDYTFLNGTLATLYGLEKNVTGPEMRKVKLTDANRGGILGMPGILATTSFPNRTSPVKRGVWVLEQVLGEHVPPAPPNVPALEKQDEKKVANLTLRQRTELHRTDAACANCHKILDPIGFGLENFDAIGRWRDKDDSGGAIDAAGELPGGKRFSSPKELKAIIAARKDDLARNLTEKLLAYALCRQLEGYDEIVVDRLMETIAKDGYRMQTLITEIVTSYPFTQSSHPETSHRLSPMTSNFRINRRTCLKGLGAALALPLLETMGWADAGKESGCQAAGSPRLHVHAARRDHGSVLAGEPGELPVVAAAGPGIAASRARPMPADEGDLGRADRSIQRRAARAGTVDLAHGDAAGCGHSGARSTSRFPRTRSPRTTWARLTSLPSLELATMPQTHKENQEGLNEGVLLALQLPLADPGRSRPRSIRAACSTGSSERPTRPGQHRPRRTRWIGRCWIWSSAAPRTFAASCPRTTSTSSTNTSTACAPWSAASPRSSIARKRRRWRRPESASANATLRIPRRSRSRFRRATNAASTCR